MSPLHASARRLPWPRPARLRSLLPALAALALVSGTLYSPWATAAPEDSDPLLKLLRERGVVGGVFSDATPARSEPTLQPWRDAATEMVLSAMGFLGVPYARGGSNAAQGFDCSGFTRHLFEHSLGLLLPRRADEQARSSALHSVRRDELRPGDLVFFNTLRRAFSHVGVYVGDGKFIHAPRSGTQVRIEDMRSAYWQRRFNGARRAAASATAAATAGTTANAAAAATAATAATAALPAEPTLH